MEFIDVRVFNPNAKRYVNQDISKTYQLNEKGKKRFAPLVVSATGGMGYKCKKFTRA